MVATSAMHSASSSTSIPPASTLFSYLVDSQKSENGKLAKCNIVLQEFGGKFENQFAAVMLGKDAQLRFYAGEVVVVKLRFQTHEYQGQVYQDILVQDIEKIIKH